MLTRLHTTLRTFLYTRPVHDDVFYEEAALEAGAVDFISKTRSFSVLRKRIELVLAGNRRDGGIPAATLKRGPLLIEPAIHQAKWNESPVSLTLGEFRVTDPDGYVCMVTHT